MMAYARRRRCLRRTSMSRLTTTTRWLVLVTLLLLLVSAPTTVTAQLPYEQQSKNACTLECNGKAPCVFTSSQAAAARFDDHPRTVDGKPFDWHAIPSIDGMHCECPHGWTGVRCDVPYETCDGNHPCYFGGECVPGLLGPFGNDQLFCNCMNAFDDGGFHMVGKYCESREENYCDDETGLFFCLNGGQCNPNFPSSGEPCICSDENFGEHCEYKRGSVAEFECTLDCGAGTCVRGEAPASLTASQSPYFSNNEETTTIDHMHCLCPDGYEGDNCEIRRTPCGDDYCFHGGKCITRNVDGTELHHCDCLAAGTDEASYAGRFCQYKATSYCSKSSDLNQHLFCVNNGVCREDPKKGCDCDEHFAGFSCEFVKSEQQPATPLDTTTTTEGEGEIGVPDDITLPKPGHPLVDPSESYECDLDCQNRGVCRNGLKDLGYLGEIAENTQHIDAAQTSEKFMHCVCGDGWTGLYCEEKLNVCGDNEHLCLHGSKCVKDGDEHGCDCDLADSDLADTFVGEHCEHPVNEICTVTKPGPGQPLLFCLNGGVCLDKVPIGQAHPGCLCGAGFRGPHCELSDRTPAPAPAAPADAPGWLPSTNAGGGNGLSASGGGMSAGEIVVVLVIIAAVLVPFFFGIRVYIQKKRQRDNTLTNNLRWASGYKDEPSQDQLNLHNISARGRPASKFHDTIYPDEDEDMAPSPTADPYVTEFTPEQSESRRPQRKRQDSDPQVYIGPPRDEDGHELHNVDIL